MSLEVAEHLSPEDEDVYLDNIIKFCRSVTRCLSLSPPHSLSAAGRGHGHLNCRENSYVIRKLFVNGFRFHEEDTKWVKNSEAFWFKETLMVFDRFAFLQDFGLFKMSMSQVNGFELSQLLHQEGRLFPVNDSVASFTWSKETLCKQAPALLDDEHVEEVVDADETVDFTAEVDMTDCSSPGEGEHLLSTCLLVFVNGKFRQTVCSHPDSRIVRVQLFALSVGVYNITLCPALPNGVTSPQQAVNLVRVVRSNNDRKSHKEEPAAAGASQEKYDELLQRLRDIEGEAEELRAIIDDLSTKTCKNEQRESSARGELEKALGLRKEDMTEIMAALPGKLSTVLDGSPLVPRANTKNLLQEVKLRSDDVKISFMLLADDVHDDDDDDENDDVDDDDDDDDDDDCDI
ncbi:hypothetical protein GUITHDRAFT_106908 [Guillardia theta CCMP2712]|uniref:Uncharacterized protein n=1 Tax=Guillardia theta (strain CCMP2712) TaxID=905079 RepID=L1JG25_GUITC|nr:hypothetical protein GUITHDRAFT_106908 [Guillardia theta CCMP2712]EKX47468.1 hypothetical protein GUITHDRAFT_106908 [Guillardia theta CCMP2712]|eukprot:XP_005834448.1 hypothetical protein GUITHDRAFT_106908 [Guillardia theta CCMP2712]